jgi:NitT/TauT family transport system substrate-binding protein
MAVALAMMASGCSSDATGGAGDGNLVKLTVAPASPSFVSQAYYYLADHLGYFEEEGLDVEIISQFEGGQPEVALVEGKFDVVAGSPTTFFERLKKDPATPTQCVATNGLWPFRIMVPAKSPATSVQDLKGKKIGVPEVSDVSTLGYMLSTAGMKGDSVSTAAVGGRAPAAIEMQKGNIEAFMGTHVDQLAIEGTGFKVRVLDTVEQSSTFNTCMLVTTQKLKDEPEVIERFLRALAKGFTLQNEDPELAVKLLGQARAEAYDDEKQALALMKATNAVNGGTYEARWKYPEEQWQAMVDSFADAGALEGTFDITKNLDFSLLEKVWDFDVEKLLEQARDAQ